jgi:hypothetical protein
MLLGLRHLEINGLHLPERHAINEARRSAVALFIETGCPEWPIGHSGTAFLYDYFGRRFCIMTRHQLKHCPHPSRIFVRLTNDEHLLQSGCRFTGPASWDTSYKDIDDICVVEMPWDFPNDGRGALFFKAGPRVVNDSDPLEKLFVLGFPSSMTDYGACPDYCDGIHLRQVRVVGRELTYDESGLHHLVLIGGGKMECLCSGDFDGFSGGPVFGLSIRDQRITFKGLTVRAGRNNLYFIDHYFVDQICIRASKRPPIPLVGVHRVTGRFSGSQPSPG